MALLLKEEFIHMMKKVIALNTLSNHQILQFARPNMYMMRMREILNTVIVAPSDGTVVSVGLKKDYILSAQDYSARPAVTIVNTKTIKFTGLVDEIDILKVKKGEKATLTIDAVPGKVFTGKVKFISPYGTKVGNVVKFAVTIELDPTDVELRGGLSTSADIVVYAAKNALLIPVLALSSGPDGHTVNVVKPDGQVETRKITIGKQNFTYVEVLSGVSEGEKLQAANNKPTSLRTGFGGPPPGGR